MVSVSTHSRIFRDPVQINYDWSIIGQLLIDMDNGEREKTKF